MRTRMIESARMSLPVGTDQHDHRRSLAAIVATLSVSGLASLALIVVARAGHEPAFLGTLLSGVCWTLVAGGVSGTCLAGAGVRCGWLILLGMQPVWIAYAIVTGQIGFVLGSVAYAGGQLNGYLRAARLP